MGHSPAGGLPLHENRPLSPCESDTGGADHRLRIPDPSSSILPWLLTTCRNVSLNVNRQQRRARADELVDGTVDERARHRTLERDAAIEQLALVRQAIDALPEIDRRLCELCLLDGRSYDEGAQLLGLSTASARKRIQRTRIRLRATRATD